ncbi:unnamed protein product [Tilletia controversa]|nr:unnamed protein product [Tilletia controversa]
MANLLSNDFREVRNGSERLAACIVCTGIKPVKLAKVRRHRATHSHQRCVRAIHAIPTRRHSPGPRRVRSIDDNEVVTENDEQILDHIADLVPIVGSARAPAVPALPRCSRDEGDTALRMQERLHYPPPRMWSMGGDDMPDNDEEYNRMEESMVNEICRIGLTPTEHENWAPFGSKQVNLSRLNAAVMQT